MCPELFTYEIICKNSPIPLEEKYKHLGMLPEEKQKMIEQEKLLDNATTEITMVSYNENRSQIARISPPKIPTPENSKHRTKAFTVWDREDPNFYKFLHMERYSIYEMYQRHYYVWEQIKTTFLESAEIIAKYREKLGSVPAALSFIRLKGDKRNLEEQKVIDGIAYLQRLLADHEEYTDEYREVMFKNQMAIFPMPKWLHDESVLQIEDMYNNHFVSQEIYTKVLGIPDNSGRDQREREIRAQKARDAMALDAKDRKEAFKLINSSQGDEILVRRDLNMKDEQLIRKMNYLTETIEVKKPKDPVPDYKNKFDPKKFVFSGERLKSSGEGELMIDTILKMLYLNNSDPSTYDVEFWADYFNMRPQHLKNIFYNISYPVLAEKEPVGKLSFIEVPRKKEIFDIFQDKQRQEMNQEIRK